MPHEMLKLQRPDVSYFRVFGCRAYVFLPEVVRQKPKSELMTFIGYADDVKGYHFMRSTNYVFNTPSHTSVREWSFCDILKLPKKEQEEWKTACQDELEVLKRQEVFEITNLPKGHKIIKNRWVFDIKTDGHKKACLVAKDLSQVKKIDFFELFSQVVPFETVHFMLALCYNFTLTIHYFSPHSTIPYIIPLDPQT
jgi:Reverse transcriptase (RNA-dependent DNA polymerase)